MVNQFEDFLSQILQYSYGCLIFYLYHFSLSPTVTEHYLFLFSLIETGQVRSAIFVTKTAVFKSKGNFFLQFHILYKYMVVEELKLPDFSFDSDSYFVDKWKVEGGF